MCKLKIIDTKQIPLLPTSSGAADGSADNREAWERSSRQTKPCGQGTRYMGATLRTFVVKRSQQLVEQEQGFRLIAYVILPTLAYIYI